MTDATRQLGEQLKSHLDNRQFVMNYIAEHGYVFASNSEQEQACKFYCEEGTLMPADKIQGLSDDEKLRLNYFYVSGSVLNRRHFPLGLVGKLDKPPVEYNKGDIGLFHLDINGLNVGSLIEILTVKQDKLEVSPVAGDNSCFWITKEQFEKTK